MPGRKPTILLVCTGNVCRSPAAEFLLRDMLGPVAGRFVIRSAGTKASLGAAMDPAIVELLAQRGSESGRFRARRLDLAMIEQADIILTASTNQRAAVVRLCPAALHKTLTLKQLARYTPHILATGLVPAQSEYRIGWILGALARARSRSPRATSDSIVDPVGKSPRQYRTSFDDVVEACSTVLPLFAGTASAASIERTVVEASREPSAAARG